MLSRVAERIYWMARYLERTEHTARLISVHTSLLMDMAEGIEIDHFTLVRLFDAESAYGEKYDERREENIMRFLIADKQNVSSLYTSLMNVRENVRTTLDVLPEESWQQINQAYLHMQRTLPNIDRREQQQQILRSLIRHCQCIRGMLDSHLSRNEMFHFAQLGQFIERADMGSRILEMTALLLSDARSETLRHNEGGLWLSLLQTLGAHQMYLQQVHKPVNAQRVLRFLVQDRFFPCSLYYALSQAGHYLAQLNAPENLLKLQENIAQQLADEHLLALPDQKTSKFMDNLQEQLAGLHQEIAAIWFDPDYFNQQQTQIS